MVKKMKSGADSSAANDSTAADSTGSGHASRSQLASSVKESAQQIWLAGMGAFAKAQEEGTKVFEALVKEGMTLQKKTQGLAEDKISEVTGKVTAMADTVTAKAGQNWDKLEAIFEARTAKAMGKLGVPTATELQALVARIEALEAQVAKLGKAGAAATKTARAAAPAAKKAAVKAPVKKATRKSA